MSEVENGVSWLHRFGSLVAVMTFLLSLIGMLASNTGNGLFPPHLGVGAQPSTAPPNKYAHPGTTRTHFVNIGGRERKHKFPGGRQPPEEVVEDALRRLRHGGGLVVPRFVNKASVFSQRFLPRGTVAKLLARMSKP